MKKNSLDKKELAHLASKHIGNFVSCQLDTGFRPYQKAEIIGWCVIDNEPYFTIRFKDNETTHIPINTEAFLKAGYIIRAS